MKKIKEEDVSTLRKIEADKEKLENSKSNRVKKAAEKIDYNIEKK